MTARSALWANDVKVVSLLCKDVFNDFINVVLVDILVTFAFLTTYSDLF